MALVSVIEASKLTGVSTQSIYRHISKGKVSKNNNGKLDTSELVRVYGELKNNDISKSENNNISMHRADSAEWYQRQIDDLKQQIEAIRIEGLKRETDAIDREKRLMALLEHNNGVSSENGFFTKLFK